MKRARGAPPADAYGVLAIPVAVGLGTITLDAPLRHAVMLGTMALVCVIYACLDPISMDASLGRVARGALLGVVVSLPFLALWPDALLLFWSRVYEGTRPSELFYQICFAAAPALEMMFRGIVWQQRGRRRRLSCSWR